MIKGIIFAYVVIAMLYYLLTVVLLCNDLNDSIMKICKNNSVIYFIFISMCGLIGGFGLPIMLLSKLIKS